MHPRALAALVIASAVPLAWAQNAPPTADFGPRPPAPVEATTAPAGDRVASPWKAEGADELTTAIVQELAADASLRGAKITVASDGGTVVLTGVAPRREQARRAYEIALARAGEGKVVNAIQVEEV